LGMDKVTTLKFKYCEFILCAFDRRIKQAMIE
jgi:hypothetical protein